MPAIVAEHLHLSRGGRPVLRDVSLRIDSGECVCLVGPNGAGKTTLLLALAGLLPPDRGRVTLDDRPLRDWTRRRIARRIAYVPQFYEGYLGFRVRDVLESARYAHRHPLQSAAPNDAVVIAEQLDRCGLRGLENRRLATLSGGERQKTWLAAALAQQADFFLLDEPTTALDPHYIAAWLGLLSAQRSAGRAILIVCHDLNVAAALNGRIVALRDGTLRFDGPAADFLREPILTDVFDARFDLASVDGRQLVFPRSAPP